MDLASLPDTSQGSPRDRDCESCGDRSGLVGSAKALHWNKKLEHSVQVGLRIIDRRSKPNERRPGRELVTGRDDMASFRRSVCGGLLGSSGATSP